MPIASVEKKTTPVYAGTRLFKRRWRFQQASEIFRHVPREHFELPRRQRPATAPTPGHSGRLVALKFERWNRPTAVRPDGGGGRGGRQPDPDEEWRAISAHSAPFGCDGDEILELLGGQREATSERVEGERTARNHELEVRQAQHTCDRSR